MAEAVRIFGIRHVGIDKCCQNTTPAHPCFRNAYKLLITKHNIARRWRTTCYNKRGDMFQTTIANESFAEGVGLHTGVYVTSAWYRPRPKRASCFAALTSTISLSKHRAQRRSR